MSETGTTSDIAADNSATFIVAVPYQGADGPVPGSYAQVLRMGAADPTIEGGVVDADGATLPDQEPARSEPGVFVYSADQYAAYSPKVTVATDDQLSLTRGPRGNILQFSAANAIGGAANYLVGRGLSMGFGMGTTLGMGGAVSATLGNSASMNTGLQFASNLGLTLNFSEGQIVTIAADDTAIQCRTGSVTSVGEGVTMATESLNYALVDPLALGGTVHRRLSKTIAALSATTVVLINTANVMFGVMAITTVSWGQERNSITTAIARLLAVAQILHAMTPVVQVMGALYGVSYHARTKTAILDTKVGLKLSQDETTKAYQAALTVGGLMPQSSVTLVGTDATVKATTISLLPTDTLTVTIADAANPANAASEIKVDKTGIYLQAGLASLTLSNGTVTAMGRTGQITTLAS